MALTVPYGLVGANGRMGLEIIAAAGSDPVFSSSSQGETLTAMPQVVIDFSSFRAIERTVELCRQWQVPLVMGTTALTKEHMALLKDLAREVPVVQSFNFSIGITLMSMMLREFGPMMADWEAELTEIHHVHKKDAPSGTAILLRNALGRDVPIHSLRLGGIPGDHEAFFGNEGEMLTIHHRAIKRSVFAIGAVKAAAWALDQKPGFYSFEDVVRGAL